MLSAAASPHSLKSLVLKALIAPEALEEIAPAEPQDLPSAAAFALDRALRAAQANRDARPLAFVAERAWLNEHGHPFGWGCRGLGLGHERLILVVAARQTETLWALEETLKSGAVCAALGAVAAPSFTATRRLDFAARAGAAQGLVLRPRPPADLSAARLRWRIGAAPSASHPLDPRAPGPARLRVELARSRTGHGGVFLLEHDPETHGFHLAAGLADHGLAPVQAPEHNTERRDAA
jgi:protein ImuA